MFTAKRCFCQNRENAQDGVLTYWRKRAPRGDRTASAKVLPVTCRDAILTAMQEAVEKESRDCRRRTPRGGYRTEQLFAAWRQNGIIAEGGRVQELRFPTGLKKVER